MTCPAPLTRGRGAAAGWTVVLLVALWALCAGAFALHRTPFDDEWFSLELASGTRGETFWRALASDVHPPWAALLDRALCALLPARVALLLPRLLAAALGIYLVSGVYAARLGLDRRVALATALHPVVFMYAGALRWYPYALCADALRAFALWAAPADPDASWSRRARAAFVAGATLGLAAGYAELPVIAVDCAWLLSRARRPAGAPARGARRAAVVTVAVALSGALLTLALSPVAAPHLRAAARVLGRARVAPSGLLAWIALGPAGEAFAPWPWGALVVVPFALALGWAVLAAARDVRQRALVAWLGTSLVGWASVVRAGVWHPRYTLLLWTGSTALLLALALARDGGRARRVAAWLALGLLAVQLGLTLDERWFVKGDLDRMTAPDCEALLRGWRPGVIVAPYPRTAAELARVCRPAAPVQSVALLSECAAALDALDARVRSATELVLVETPAGESVAAVYEAVRRRLARRCTERDSRRALEDPHWWIKQRARPESHRYRYTASRWECAAAE